MIKSLMLTIILIILPFFNGIILLIEQALINFKIFTGIDVYDDYYCVNKYLTEVRKNGNAN